MRFASLILGAISFAQGGRLTRGEKDKIGGYDVFRAGIVGSEDAPRVQVYTLKPLNGKVFFETHQDRLRSDNDFGTIHVDIYGNAPPGEFCRKGTLLESSEQNKITTTAYPNPNADNYDTLTSDGVLGVAEFTVEHFDGQTNTQIYFPNPNGSNGELRFCVQTSIQGDGGELLNFFDVRFELTVVHSATFSQIVELKESEQPSWRPSAQPSWTPSAQPSWTPSAQPSWIPSVIPSTTPSRIPSPVPTGNPSVSLFPSREGDTRSPSAIPSYDQSSLPSGNPSYDPSSMPSGNPSLRPSFAPTQQPTSSTQLFSGFEKGTPAAQVQAGVLKSFSTQPNEQQPNEQQPAAQIENVVASKGILHALLRRNEVETVVEVNSMPCEEIEGVDVSDKDCFEIWITITAPPYTGVDPLAITSLIEEEVTTGEFVEALAETGLQGGVVALPPSEEPSSTPSDLPSSEPSDAPSPEPTVSHQPSLSIEPSMEPTSQPSESLVPTLSPSGTPSVLPSLSPSATPTDAPTAYCINDNTFFLNGDATKGCSWAAKNPLRRCAKKDKVRDKEVKFFCPLECKLECENLISAAPSMAPVTYDACMNDDSFLFNGKKKKDCAWAAKQPKVRCRKKDRITKKRIRAFCPGVCKKECHSAFPSEVPSDAPSDGPGACDLDTTGYHLPDDPSKDCAWVAKSPENRCLKKDKVAKKKVRKFCPSSCNLQCLCKNSRLPFLFEDSKLKCKDISLEFCPQEAVYQKKTTLVEAICPRKCDSCFDTEIENS